MSHSLDFMACVLLTPEAEPVSTLGRGGLIATDELLVSGEYYFYFIYFSLH